MRVIVIGTGLLGTTTAWFLTERGHEVVLIDRQPGAAMETSFANGGIIHASNAAPWNSPDVVRQFLRWAGRPNAPLVLRLKALPGLLGWGWQFLRYSRPERFQATLRRNARISVYSLEQLQHLQHAAGLDYHAGDHGALAVFRDPAALAAAAREASLLEAAGVRHELLDSPSLVQLEPALSGQQQRLAGGLYYPDDRSGDARLFTEQLTADAARRGADLRLATEVTSLLRDRNRVTGVMTERGEFRADACVLAAGSYSPALARPLGLRLPIYPIKGYSITLPLPPAVPAPQVPLIDAGRKIVITRLGKQLRVAGVAEFAGHDMRIDPRRISALHADLSELFPDLASATAGADNQAWAGLRPTTASGAPLLGHSGINGLYLATGTGHLGWTMAAGAGRIVADIVSGHSPEIDPDL